MKTYLSAALILISALIFLTACPYTSDVAITPATEKVNKKMLGKWVKASDMDKEHPEFLQISKFEKTKYKIEKNEYNSTDSVYDVTIFISHTSTLGDYIFINMQKSGENEFNIYRIEPDGDNSFKLYEVTDNIDEKFTKSEDLKAFVDKYKELSFFYNSDETKYIREK